MSASQRDSFAHLHRSSSGVDARSDRNIGILPTSPPKVHRKPRLSALASTMTAVTLSGAPPSSVTAMSACATAAMSAAAMQPAISASGTTCVRPSEQSRNRSPGRTWSRSSPAPAGACAPHGARDRRETPRGRAVVTGHLFEPAGSPPVHPAVAGPQHGAPAAAHEEHHHRAAAAAADQANGPPSRHELVVDLLQPLARRADRLVEAPHRLEIRQRVAHHPAGDLTVAVAAEPVGHDPEPDLRQLEERILVDLPDVADVARGRRLEAEAPRRRAVAGGREPFASTTAGTGRH